ncbi:hypothetical protein [Nonomuraea turcica]|uniref:hypothetical protein n=1 Tax=Nonomuraea sp. G32 TaxID=3067274 RepID=UPI00273B174D|nr:hypothetical protein [Nonomuraea sp. G32]MDP4503948.1 hypothetical protein [Nonomuraea sp. G32]
MAFSPDGKTLVAAAADRVEVLGDAYAVWQWDTTPRIGGAAATVCAGRPVPHTWAAFVVGVPYREVC